MAEPDLLLSTGFVALITPIGEPVVDASAANGRIAATAAPRRRQDHLRPRALIARWQAPS